MGTRVPGLCGYGIRVIGINLNKVFGFGVRDLARWKEEAGRLTDGRYGLTSAYVPHLNISKIYIRWLVDVAAYFQTAEF